ncbi:DUF1684 domain-containing protein [Luteimonas sp. 100069]|uniref:DUF1684 domain-containing protein n=1 Tax=Luteimonas sp. 100069 TaxID=2006109 RepID=UPI000F4F85B3|nr:DUF1684 domain-containing protein [Luteimonas sp. 100069]RPD86422.1 DUF1684 domain-containing protein [Luteimonas sp. 100069]
MLRWRHCVTIGLAMLLVACGVTSDSQDPAARADAARLDVVFSAQTRVWQDKRRAELVSPDGWLSLIGLHRIELKSHFIGSGQAAGIRLSMGPEKLGLLQSDEGAYWFTPERGVVVTLDDVPVRGRVRLLSDADASPSALGFDAGKGTLSIIERGGVAFVRARHEDARTRTRFTGLEYWPTARDWQVDATFEPARAGATLPIANILGMIEDMPTPGTVTFERDGSRYALQALQGDDDTLFLIFADRTSGHGSYSAGRYLDAPLPDDEGRLRLDFNRAYNPPCAFTAFATCPLPPAGNRLDLAVSAGEKAYRPPPPPTLE